MTLWGLARVDGANLDKLRNVLLDMPPCNSCSGAHISKSYSGSSTSSGPEDDMDSLNTSELTCSAFKDELDSILKTLVEIGAAYEDVTGRTNSLMVNCESLLERQRTLETTAEVLRRTLQPFAEVESVAALLGIPFSTSALGSVATGGVSGTDKSNSGGSPLVLDPRSPEFHDVLTRLSKAMAFLDEHRELYDSSLYYRWLEQLAHRASSLVARAMRELLEGASRLCVEMDKRSKAAQRATNAWHMNSTAAVSVSGAISVSAKGGSGGALTVADDTPLESLPLYQKFRGLGFRMQELGQLLRGTGPGSGNLSANAAKAGSVVAGDLSPVHPHAHSQSLTGSGSAGGLFLSVESLSAAHSEVKQAYSLVRVQLLVPFMREAALAASTEQAQALAKMRTHTPQVGQGDEARTGIPAMPLAFPLPPLSPVIRQAYSTLLRVAQLEIQLFDTLFASMVPSFPGIDDSSSHNNPSSRVPMPSASYIDTTSLAELSTESGSHAGFVNGSGSGAGTGSALMRVIEAACTVVGDGLRPLIIKESRVDELCRVVTTLAEDIRSQIVAMTSVPRPVLVRLLGGLDKTVNDAQERLAYCAEVRLRSDVVLFEPSEADLDYPEVLQLQQPTDAAVQAPQDMSASWYPPLRDTLSLLSRLYGVVEMGVFEDFARRSVGGCVAALKGGREGVRKRVGSTLGPASHSLHADLFLVRHLLILREQLLPFEIRMTSTERKLDFRPTFAAAHSFLSNARMTLRMDANNALLALAREGLPALAESQRDAKRDLDLTLKAACLELKITVVKMLVSPLSALLAKVEAFVGPVPIDAAASSAGTVGVSSWHSAGDVVDSSQVLMEAGPQTLKQPSSTVLAAEDNYYPLPLAPDQISLLRSQAFVRPDRIKEAIADTHSQVATAGATLQASFSAYIDNGLARTILMKPVALEVDAVRRRVQCVVASCVGGTAADDGGGSTRREIEAALRDCYASVVAVLQA